MTQIVKCKDCGMIFAACCEPLCYTDSEWKRNLNKYVERGDIVEMIKSGTQIQVFGCVCSDADKNQQTLGF